MKNGLLVCSPRYKKKNIGDYIQSVAQEQFYEHIDCYVEREKLDSFESDELTRVIMNGWFMWNPTHFPPSSKIVPLFISFHITPNIISQFMRKEVIDYLKSHAPIGARDTSTKELLESYGIPAYYSGCLTITLGMKYQSPIKTNSFYFVDPFYETSGTRRSLLQVKLYLKTMARYLRYRKKLEKVIPHFKNEYRTIWGSISKRLETKLCAADFYADYHTLFTDDLLNRAAYIKHDIEVDDYTDNIFCLNYAKELINKYAQAKLVITSRIHCALPCVGLGTPTLFINSDVLDGGSLRPADRMGGIKDLFHSIGYTKYGFIQVPKEIEKVMKNGKIGIDINLQNPSDYIELKKNLINKVQKFINITSKQ